MKCEYCKWWNKELDGLCERVNLKDSKARCGWEDGGFFTDEDFFCNQFELNTNVEIVDKILKRIK